MQNSDTLGVGRADSDDVATGNDCVAADVDYGDFESDDGASDRDAQYDDGQAALNDRCRCVRRSQDFRPDRLAFAAGFPVRSFWNSHEMV